MKWFKAVTESGTVYSHDPEKGSFIEIQSSGQSGLPSDVIKGRMTVVPVEKITEWINENEGRLDHKWLVENSGAEVPVVGARLYVSGFSSWRLSSVIEKVEEK